MKDPRRLQQAIRDLHGLDAEHVRSEPVHEGFRGETVWQGTVEVFTVTAHPKATHAYAWSSKTTAARRIVPPVNSPQNAVKAAVVAHIKRRQQ